MKLISTRLSSEDRLILLVIAVSLVLAIPMVVFLHPAVLAIIGVCVIILLVFLRAPAYMLLLLILLRASIDNLARQYRLFDDTALSVNLLGILNITLVVMATFYFVVLKHRIPAYPFVVLYLLLLSMAAVSIAVSEDFGTSMRGWMTIASFLAMYTLAVSQFKSESLLRWLRAALALSAVFPITAGLIQFATGTGNTTISPSLNRIMGTLFHPSAFGMYLVILWPLMLFQARYTQRWWVRLFYTLLLALATFSIVVTYTRVTWVALILCVLGALVVLRSFDYVIAFGAIITLAGTLFLKPIMARFGEAVQIESGHIVFSEFGSVAWRFEQWRTAFELFTSHSLLGVGWWTFPLYNVWGTTPHNDYLRVAAESGILGLTCYLALMIALVAWFTRAYLRLPTHSKEAILVGFTLISILAFILLSITDNPLGLPEVGWYFWVLIALGVCTVRSAKIKSATPHQSREIAL